MSQASTDSQSSQPLSQSSQNSQNQSIQVSFRTRKKITSMSQPSADDSNFEIDRLVIEGLFEY